MTKGKRKGGEERKRLEGDKSIFCDLKACIIFQCCQLMTLNVIQNVVKAVSIKTQKLQCTFDKRYSKIYFELCVHHLLELTASKQVLLYTKCYCKPEVLREYKKTSLSLITVRHLGLIQTKFKWHTY